MRSVDFLKFSAIVLVIIYHLYPGIMPSGFLGVDIFLVVTGFLAAKTLDYTSPKDFLRGRMARVHRALLVSVSLMLMLSLLFLYDGETREIARYTASALTYTTNGLLFARDGYFALSPQENPLFHLWSIAIEVQLWFLLALYFWVISHCPREKVGLLLGGVLGTASLAGFVFALGSENFERAYLFPDVRAWEPLVGVLAYYARKVWPIELKIGWFLEIWLLILLVFAATAEVKLEIRTWLLVPFACALWLYLDGSKKAGIWPLYRWFSQRTYSLYLVHVPVFFMASQFTELSGVLMFFLALLVGDVWYRYVE